MTSVRCHHKRDGVCASATYESEHQAEGAVGEVVKVESQISKCAETWGAPAYLSMFALYSPSIKEHNCGAVKGGQNVKREGFYAR
jgi:hypothetical protein